MCRSTDRYYTGSGGQAMYHDGHKIAFSLWRKWIRAVECGILAIKKTSMKTLQIELYRKYPNLVRTRAEIISDPNYLVHILFER